MTQTFAPISERYVRPQLPSGASWPSSISGPLSFLFFDRSSQPSSEAIAAQKSSFHEVLDHLLSLSRPDKTANFEKSVQGRWPDWLRLLDTYVDDQRAVDLLHLLDASDSRVGKPQSLPGLRVTDPKGRTLTLDIPSAVFGDINPVAWRQKLITHRGDRNLHRDEHGNLRLTADDIRFRDPTWSDPPRIDPKRPRLAPGARGQDILAYFDLAANRALQRDRIALGSLLKTLSPGHPLLSVRLLPQGVATDRDIPASMVPRVSTHLRLPFNAADPANARRLIQALAGTDIRVDPRASARSGVNPRESARTGAHPRASARSDEPTRKPSRYLPLSLDPGSGQPIDVLAKFLNPADPKDLPAADIPLPGTGKSSADLDDAKNGERSGRAEIYDPQNEHLSGDSFVLDRDARIRSGAHLDDAEQSNVARRASPRQKEAYEQAVQRVRDAFVAFRRKVNAGTLHKNPETLKKAVGILSLLDLKPGESHRAHVDRVSEAVSKSKPNPNSDSRIRWVLDTLNNPRTEALFADRFGDAMRTAVNSRQAIEALGELRVLRDREGNTKTVHGVKNVRAIRQPDILSTIRSLSTSGERDDFTAALRIIRAIDRESRNNGDRLNRRLDPTVNRFTEAEASHREVASLLDRLLSRDAMVRETYPAKRKAIARDLRLLLNRRKGTA